MKRIIALFLALLLVFSFAGCGKNNTSSDSSVPGQSEDFVKPENYATVLYIKINPEFNLYLDAKGNVLAIEPLNDDAKTFSDDIKIANQNFEKVINNIISKANDNGFVKTEDILSKSTSTANKVAADLGLRISVSTKADIIVSTEDAEPNFKEDDSNNKIEDKNQDNNNQKTENDKVTDKEPENKHKHIFASATCVSPAKCVDCGITVGEALQHRFNKGMCTICGAHDENYQPKYTAISQKNGHWVARFVGDNTLFDVSATFIKSSEEFGMSVGFGDPFSKLPPDFQEDIRNENSESYVVLEGKEYYIGRGDGDTLGDVTEDNNIVTVLDLDGNKLVLRRINENTLSVTESPATFAIVGKIPVGTEFNFQ